MKSSEYYLKEYKKMEAQFDKIAGQQLRFESDGLQLEYRVIPGSSVSDTPILFIHGWGSSMMNWYFQVKDKNLHERMIYLVDLPGHGRNKDFSKIQDVSYSAYITLLQQFIDTIVKQKPIVVGHSMGGILAKLIFRSEYAVRAIYLNPAVQSIKLPRLLRRMIKRFVRDDGFSYKVMNKLLRNRFVLKAWSRALSDKTSPTYDSNDVITIADMYLAGKNAFWGFITNMVEVSKDEYQPGKLSDRELLVLTQNDITIPKKLSLEITTGKDGGNTVMLSRGGHCSPRTIFEDINQIMYSFIKPVENAV